MCIVCTGSFVDGEWQGNHTDAILESSTHHDTDYQHHRDNNYLHFCSIFHPQLLLCCVTDSSLMKPQRIEKAQFTLCTGEQPEHLAVIHGSAALLADDTSC